MSDSSQVARLSGPFIINLHLICAEIVSSCPDIIVTVFTSVRLTIEIRIIVTICVTCYVNIMSPTECRTIIPIIVCCTTMIANVLFKVSISVVVFEWKYEGFRWRSVLSIITIITIIVSVSVVIWNIAHRLHLEIFDHLYSKQNIWIDN